MRRVINTLALLSPITSTGLMRSYASNAARHRSNAQRINLL